MTVWFSPSTQVIAQRRAGALHLLGGGLDVVLEGAFADEFLGAFQGGPGPGAALEALGRLGGPLHRRLLEVAKSADARRWVPASAYGTESTLFLELTGQCNERCVHCYAESAPEVTEQLDEQTATRVVREAAALGFQRLQLTGGDPLLCRFVPALAAEGRAAGIPTVEVYTNGLALDDERLTALGQLGVRFAFSFYSHDPERHDAMTRVPGSQGRTASAIERAVRSGAGVRVAIIALDDDPGHLERTRAFLAALGVKPGAIGADRVRLVGRGEETGFTGAWAPGTGQGAHGGGPSAGGDGPRLTWPGKLCVSYTGQVYPCIFSRWLPLGDIRRQSLREILDGLRARARDSAPAERLAERLTCFDCRLTAMTTALEAPR